MSERVFRSSHAALSAVPGFFAYTGLFRKNLTLSEIYYSVTKCHRSISMHQIVELPLFFFPDFGTWKLYTFVPPAGASVHHGNSSVHFLNNPVQMQEFCLRLCCNSVLQNLLSSLAALFFCIGDYYCTRGSHFLNSSCCCLILLDKHNVRTKILSLT